MSTWDDYRAAINAAAEREDTSMRAAEAVVRQMPRASLGGILVRLTHREIEKAHDLYELTKPRPPSKPLRDYAPLFAEVYDHPERQSGRRAVRLNAKERSKFRRWCDQQGHDFQGWLDRLISAARDPEMAKLDWIPGYRTPSMEEIDRQFWKKTTGYIEEFAQAIRFEVTAELLGSKFKLSDGRQVTWSDATVADHEDRVEAFGREAQKAGGQAAMHQRAVELLKRHGAETLGQLDDSQAVAS